MIRYFRKMKSTNARRQHLVRAVSSWRGGDDFVPMTARFDETTLREKLRKLKAKWDPEKKVWLVR